MDYAEPITPGDAVRGAAEQLRYLAQRERLMASLAIAKAEGYEDAVRRLTSEADSLDRYQPKATTDG